MITPGTVAVRLRELADRVEGLCDKAEEAQVSSFELDDRVDDVEQALDDFEEEIEKSLNDDDEESDDESDDEGDDDEEDE